jgi:type I restriction enzyme M protein
VVLTNPPFGIKGSVTYVQERRGTRNDDSLVVVRPDFWVQTANKQLNFLQHIFASLKPGGRAAVVIPDNVLFETGAASAVRRRLLEACRVHALLRLPSGLFYAQGVKSNVIFLNKPRSPGSGPASQLIWAYDLRSDKRFSLKTRPLHRDDLQEFVGLFRSHTGLAGAQGAARLKSFDAKQILSTADCRLDFAWKDPSAQQRSPGLARLDEISRLVAKDLHRALALISKAAAN